MIKPTFLEPEDHPTQIAQVFGAPLVVVGWTGLPLIELATFGIFSYINGRNHPDWIQSKRLSISALSAILLLGSEWCHNLAHAAVANWIGKPVDAIRDFWGTPLLIYFDSSNQNVSPDEHILRALGGPMFNACMVPLAWLAKQFIPDGSLAHHFADFCLRVNAIFSTASLLPIPGLDGGSLLEWVFVKRGQNAEQADKAVKKVNLYVGSGLAAASGIAMKKKNPWVSIGLAFLAVLSFTIGFGLLKEHK